MYDAVSQIMHCDALAQLLIICLQISPKGIYVLYASVVKIWGFPNMYVVRYTHVDAGIPNIILLLAQRADRIELNYELYNMLTYYV